MLNCVAIISIIGLLIGYDIVLRLASFFAPRRAIETAQRCVRRVAHMIFGIADTYAGVKVDFENRSGRDLPERFLLVTNHQSLLDIPLLIDVFPERRIRFVAKKELGLGIPFISLILRSQGHALITRKGDATRAMRAILRMARRCEAEGSCPTIFPEGTRSRDGEVHEFHTAGVRKILDETPLPMVVAVLDGGWRLAKVKDVLGNLQESRFRVRVLEVTPPLSSKREVLSALDKAHADIVLSLERMRSGE